MICVHIMHLRPVGLKEAGGRREWGQKGNNKVERHMLCFVEHPFGPCAPQGMAWGPARAAPVAGQCQVPRHASPRLAV